MAKLKDSTGGLLGAFLDCRNVLARLVGRFVNAHEVDDVLQETFIRTYVASQTAAIRHPRAFMLKTARNLALNRATSAHSTRTLHTEDLGVSAVYALRTETLESQVESRERFLGFCRAVRELPDQCRRVFVLKKVYGLSQQEIAQFLSISESTVEKHVAKGLLMCRASMHDMGFEVNRGGDAKSKRGNRRG